MPQFYGGRFFGSVTVAGLDTLEYPIHRLAQQVGLVFEDPETQITATSVANEIAFPLENLGIPRAEIQARIPIALAHVGLTGTEGRPPHELSGGQKQRLAIAAALAIQPQLLVLDEPTSQLDPQGAQDIFAILRELNREQGLTLVVASHDAEALAEHANRLLLLDAGACVALETPRRLYGQVPLLERHQVRPPQVAAAFHLLREAGAPVPEIPVTLAAGLAQLHTLRAAQRLAPLPASPPSSPPAGPPLITVERLTHIFDDGLVALRDISLTLHTGEYILIAGENGAGKTTLVKHLLRLLTPTSGSVIAFGQDTRTLTVSTLARRIGYVAQNPSHQLFNTTVANEVAFALRYLDYSPAEIAERVAANLAALGLAAHAETHPLALPQGDRARVVIAAILALEPEVIIFDEPTTGQDYQGARAILDLSRALHATGKTIVVITHHLYLMPEYAERMIVLGEGRLLLDAPLREAYHALPTLHTSHLIPPQIVQLSRDLCPEHTLLTPAELVACLTQEPPPCAR